MKHEKILTIVVPSYNTQEFIDDCIPTMLLHRCTEQLELLLINDGSSDHTLEKLRFYEYKYPQTVKVIDKQNGGHGSVINLAVEKAAGIFLKIVDGDDWVISKNLETLIRNLEFCQADLAVNPYIIHDMHSGRERKVTIPIEPDQQMLFEDIAARLPEVAVHAAAYRTSILREHKIRLREKCFYEDTEYNIYPIRYVRSICAYKEPVNVYRVGTRQQSIHPDRAFANRRMHGRIIEDCMQYYKHNRRYLTDGKRRYVERIICSRIRSHYMIYLKHNLQKEQLQELQEWNCRLKKMSGYFYRMTERFPVNVLRLNIRTFPLVRAMYLLYSLMPLGMP